MGAGTKDELVRFGVAMEAPLLEAFDALVRRRGGTRSEALRDLVRAEVTRAQVAIGVDAVGALTLVYDHHVRLLNEKLTDIQHDAYHNILSTMHVHLDHDNCLEVIIVRGKAKDVRRIADALITMKGVKHGNLNITSSGADL